MAPPDANRAITPNSVVVATKDQVSSDLAGEAVVLSLRTAMYYGLDQVGLRIWELVREPMRVAAIRDTIAQEYEVELERCERDVLDLLHQLASEGLIEVRDATEAAR
jgi:coenzyme PQQ synthesis protein D (PqqD)